MTGSSTVQLATTVRREPYQLSSTLCMLQQVVQFELMVFTNLKLSVQYSTFCFYPGLGVTILLVSTKERDLWLVQNQEVHESLTPGSATEI